MKQEFSIAAEDIKQVLKNVLHLYAGPWRLNERFATVADLDQKLSNMQDHVVNGIIGLVRESGISAGSGDRFVGSLMRDVANISKQYADAEGDKLRQDVLSIYAKLTLHAGEYVARVRYQIDLSDNSAFSVYRRSFRSHPKFDREATIV